MKRRPKFLTPVPFENQTHLWETKCRTQQNESFSFKAKIPCYFQLHSKQEKGNTHAKWTRNLVKKDTRYGLYMLILLDNCFKSFCLIPTWLNRKTTQTYKNQTIRTGREEFFWAPSKYTASNLIFKRKFLVFFTLRPYPHSESLQHCSLWSICRCR